MPADGRPKYYVLEMFPYPSGKIHMGHVRNYTLGDVVARYKRARGFAVLHPMGWDAFGLPAENAARERGVHPGDLDLRQHRRDARPSCSAWACRSTGGASSPPAIRTITASSRRCSSTSWRAGLVERRESWVNWDPVDGTVLANEQVIDGRGWRSGALVEKKQLSQWFLRITDYAPELLAALDDAGPLAGAGAADAGELDRPQRGRAPALRLDAPEAGIDAVEVYTTRPDTLFGMSFLALAPEHPLAAGLAARNPAAAAFIAECRRMGTSEAAIETAEKRGFDTGLRVAPSLRRRTRRSRSGSPISC